MTLRSRVLREARSKTSEMRLRPSADFSEALSMRPTSLKMAPHFWSSCASRRSFLAWTVASLAWATIDCGSVEPPTSTTASAVRWTGLTPARWRWSVYSATSLSSALA